MDIYRACQDVEATRVVQKSGMGFAVGIPYKTIESYSPNFCAESSVSETDAKAKLENVVKGYCSSEGTKTCLRNGDVEVKRVGKWRQVFDNFLVHLFGWHANNM